MVEPCVWKANLLGGGRLLATYRAFVNSAERSIGSFLAERKPDWACSEGYAIGKKGAHEQSKLTNLTCLRKDATKGGHVEWTRTSTVLEEKFKSTGDLRVYTPPHLIIWKHESLDSHLRVDGDDLAFTKRFVGISCPTADVEQLNDLAHFINHSRTELLFFIAFGHEFLVNRTASVLKEDIMCLPFPNDGKLVFRGVEEALKEDVLTYQIQFIKAGARPTSPLFKAATSAQLDQFNRMFERVLRNTHPHLKACMRYDLGNAYCVSFVFGDQPSATIGDPQQLEEHLDTLLQRRKSPALRIQRVVRIFDGNCLFFVKPKALRFWTRSIAIRDADEVFASLQEQSL